MGEKSGSLAVYGAAGEAVRALHLTAPLSEPTLNPRTIALCHLELWHTLIMPSRMEMYGVKALCATCKQLPQVELFGQK